MPIKGETCISLSRLCLMSAPVRTGNVYKYGHRQMYCALHISWRRRPFGETVINSYRVKGIAEQARIAQHHHLIGPRYAALLQQRPQSARTELPSLAP